MKHATHNTKLITFMFILFFVLCFMFYDSAMAQVKLETVLPPIAGQPSPSEGLPQYINYLFIFGLGLIAVLALGQMMIGGLTYILAAGNVAKVETAKDTIQQALLGLGLLLVSYLLLRTINPDLVNLRNPSLELTQFQGNELTGISFEWKEPPSCPENWYPTNKNQCSAEDKLPNYICCTNESASVMPSHDYYIWVDKQCREGENELEGRICRDQGLTKPLPGYVCCYHP